MLRELIALENDSKVWIYQSDREFSQSESEEIREKVFSFVHQWSSHGHGVKAYGNLFHNRFIVLFADKAFEVSGCSIDSSVHFIKKIEQDYNVNMFDRMLFSFMVDEEVVSIKAPELTNAIKNGEIDMDTLAFDNLVDTKEKFLKNWLVPLKDSWHARFA